MSRDQGEYAKQIAAALPRRRGRSVSPYTPAGGSLPDFTRAPTLTPGVADAVDEAFEYHPWMPGQVEIGAQVRSVLAQAVKVIIAAVPPSADRTTAIRKIREARMDCNSAITHNGRF